MPDDLRVFKVSLRKKIKKKKNNNNKKRFVIRDFLIDGKALPRPVKLISK